MTDRLNIAIVGAGIGGLSAALALSARGMNVTVFEDAESPREAGAGISIPPNAVILLKRTSALAMRSRRSPQGARDLRCERHGESLFRGRVRPRLLSYQIHRVELLDMLLGAGERTGPIRTSLYCRR